MVADQGAPQELVTPETGVVSVTGDAESLRDALLAGFELSGRPPTIDACRAEAAKYDWDLAIAPLLEELYEQSRQTSSVR